MDKGEFNRWLFEVMNTVTLVAECRGRILGFLYATLEETSAGSYFSPSRRSTGGVGSVPPCTTS